MPNITYEHVYKIPTDEEYIYPQSYEPIRELTNVAFATFDTNTKSKTLVLNWKNIVGDKTLQSGGYLGDMLSVLRVHLEDLKDTGELSEAISGEVYSNLFGQAMVQSIEVEKANNTLYLQSLEQLNNSRLLNIQLDQENVKLNTMRKEYEELLPLNVRKLKEETQLVHAQHKQAEQDFLIKRFIHERLQPIEELNNLHKKDGEEAKTDLTKTENIIKQYYSNEMQGVEKEVLVNNACVTAKECQIKTYYHSVLQPLEGEKLSAQTSAETFRTSNILPLERDGLAKDVCIKEAKCDAEKFYTTSMQPLERDTLIGKSMQELIKAGYSDRETFNIEDSLSYLQNEATKVQNALYMRQTEAFDERRDQELLKLQMNYRGLIFADNPEPVIPDLVKEPNINNVYKSLTNTDVIVVQEEEE